MPRIKSIVNGSLNVTQKVEALQAELKIELAHLDEQRRQIKEYLDALNLRHQLAPKKVGRPAGRPRKIAVDIPQPWQSSTESAE